MLFRSWAVKGKHTDSDPTRDLKTIRPRTEGHTPWPQEWCDAFEARWARGTRERLAYDVLLYTGFRIGDAVRVGRPHVKNGIITLRTEKAEPLSLFQFSPLGRHRSTRDRLAN